MLKGTEIRFDLASPVLWIRGPDHAMVGCFPLSRIVGVVDEEIYQEGRKESAAEPDSPWTVSLNDC